MTRMADRFAPSDSRCYDPRQHLEFLHAVWTRRTPFTYVFLRHQHRHLSADGIRGRHDESKRRCWRSA